MAGLSVEPCLYDFLKENECKLYKEKNRMVACVFVDFKMLPEFVGIVGSYSFEEGGIAVFMKADYIAIELNDFFEGLGQSVVDYKSVFDNYDWQHNYESLKEEYGEEYPDVFG
ncbi:hypothetical protein [Paenibacillus shenyangensis]|uniref:hypothetical protein n=1 Tax=Paenibacillus sp. A9 TaxID=1284352 RepID=UPI00035EE76E|nr:hypothetical protein [Paenibacillus sp. A9]